MIDFNPLEFMNQAPTQAIIDKKIYLRALSPFLGLDVTSAAMTCFLWKAQHLPRAAGTSAKPAEPPMLGQGHSHRWAFRIPGRQQLWHPPAQLDCTGIRGNFEISPQCNFLFQVNQ